MSTSEDRPENDRAREAIRDASISAIQAIQAINEILPKLGQKSDAALIDALIELKAFLFDSMKALNEVRGR